MKGRNEMKLSIRNIAKVKEADIEINGITVIAGENSTGKSTIGKVLYCVYETFYDIENKIGRERENSIYNVLRRNIVSNSQMRDKELYFDPIFDTGVVQELLVKILDFCTTHRDATINQYIDMLNEFKKDDIYDIKDIEELSEYIHLVNTMTANQVNGTLMYKCMNEEFNTQFLPLFKRREETSIDLKLKNDQIVMAYDADDQTFLIDKFFPISQAIVYLDNPYLIDAIETDKYIYRRKYGIVSNHETKMNRMIRGDVENSDISVFDEIINKKNTNLLEKKIVKLLNGDFVMDNNHLRFKEEGMESAMRISNLSMGSKSVALILKLIKSGNIVENGIIVLDEPEIHLHPKWQVDFAELLVMLQQTFNLNIVLTSHSPYFINAIEVYSAKYKIADKCKYYLADIDIDGKAIFNDVTTNIDSIYSKLIQPLLDLEDVL